MQCVRNRRLLRQMPCSSRLSLMLLTLPGIQLHKFAIPVLFKPLDISALAETMQIYLSDHLTQLCHNTTCDTTKKVVLW